MSVGGGGGDFSVHVSVTLRMVPPNIGVFFSTINDYGRSRSSAIGIEKTHCVKKKKLN